jgi:tRNA (adenine37-N6)-methyltransferase
MILSMQPIGYVRDGRTTPTKDNWGSNSCTLELLPERFTTAAVAGLEEVSHLEVVFYFHLQADEPPELGARHPRERADWPAVGIFAQHGRMRPNRLGVSICRLMRVSGLSIEVEGLDAVDGTPLLDINFRPAVCDVILRCSVLNPVGDNQPGSEI